MNLVKQIKLNSTLISFLPIFIFIPLGFQLLNNFHFGGIEIFTEFLSSIVSPNLNIEILINLFTRLKETIYIAFASWILSITFGSILGVFSSDIFFEIFKMPKFTKLFIRFILAILRSIHELVWCLILMQIYGINISVGIIAICIPYTAINAKVFSEQLQEVNYKRYESIKSISTNRFSTLITLIWIPFSEVIQNFGLYRLECSIRSATILGLFGIGGIGTNIILNFKALNFNTLWTSLWALALLVIISKAFIYNFKFKYLKTNKSIFLLIIFSTLFIYYFFFIFYFLINSNLNLSYFFEAFTFSNINISMNELISDSLTTILITLCSTAIAISLPPVLFLVFDNKFMIYILRIFAFWLRLIPPTIVILILLIFNQPSIGLAAFTLGIHNAAITFRLLNINLNEINKDLYKGMINFGSSKRVSWIYGLFSMQSKSYLAYCSYRSEIIIRETAIVGIIGGTGLGWQLTESLSSFAWEEIFFILIAYSSIAMVGEIISGKIKSNLN